MMPAGLLRRRLRGDGDNARGVDAEDPIELTGTNADSDATVVADPDAKPEERRPEAVHRSRLRWRHVLVHGVLPGLALVMALGAGGLKWYESFSRDSRIAAGDSVRAASDGAVAMLSYRPESVEKDLGAARERMTGALKDSYSALIHDVVIPGSKQKMISASASVPAAASVSASPDHAVVLMFVNQTTVIGNDPPTNTASRVRVSLDNVNGRWLISSFDPI